MRSFCQIGGLFDLPEVLWVGDKISSRPFRIIGEISGSSPGATPIVSSTSIGTFCGRRVTSDPDGKRATLKGVVGRIGASDWRDSCRTSYVRGADD
uniref:Putative ovule protein n=1 Tax=Solanum chacoense TaxID=4108 RepID=A0A0V0HH22_SOLCH